MIPKFGFDFADRYFEFNGISFGFRVCTLENVYGIDPGNVRVTGDDSALRIEADSLQYAGGQRRCAGRISVLMRRNDGRTRFQVVAEHSVTIKGITILIRDLAAPVEEEIVSEWPDRDMSVWFPEIETVDGNLAVVMPATTALRFRRWCVYRDYSEHWVLNLTEDAEYVGRSETMAGSEWILDPHGTHDASIREWYRMLEKERGLRTWNGRTDVPEWFRKVSLVLNMHCEGWTGYVFNTFDSQLEILRWFAKRIDGSHVMPFLAGWAGRYYWNDPLYEPSEQCGGHDGLKRLVDGAHELGMHVVPMFGLISSNLLNTRKLGLEDAVCRMVYGMEELCNWTGWDEDLLNDPIWHALNVGNDKFREHLFGRITDITDTFGMDGCMLDISLWLPRDPRHDLFAGLVRLVGDLRARYDNYLVWGENGTDVHLPVLPVFEGASHLPPDHPFHRYCRTASHLFTGAPGRNSTGVFESGCSPFHVPSPDSVTIPTAAVVDDTFPLHASEMEAVVEAAKEWAARNTGTAYRLVDDDRE